MLRSKLEFDQFSNSHISDLFNDSGFGRRDCEMAWAIDQRKKKKEKRREVILRICIVSSLHYPMKHP